MAEGTTLTRSARQSLSEWDTTTRENTQDSNASEPLTEETVRAYSQDGDIENGANNEQGIVVAIPATPKPRRIRRVLGTPTKTIKRTVAGKGHDTELLKTILHTIQELRNGKDEMQQKLTNITAELAATRKELEDTKTMLMASNGQLRMTLREIQTRVTAKPTIATDQTWAAIAARSQNGQEHTHMTNDCSKQTAAQCRDMTLEDLKKLAEKELEEKLPAAKAKISGINRVARERIDLTMETKEQAEAARDDTNWVRGFGEEAKMKLATWYPIKLDGVLREVLCMNEGDGWQFRSDAAQIIESGNSKEGINVKVKMMHWISKPTEKMQGSIVAYLDSWAAA
ncbi:hypothetical protein B7463_g9555, partial [Scytalidium lignicola]